MKAVVIVPGPGGAVLEYRSGIPIPQPKSSEILVRVRAAGLNFADLRRSAMHYGHGEQGSDAIAGLEIAGEVVEAGRQAECFAVGTRVMAMVAGAYAEFACVDARLAVEVPEHLDWQQAAAIPVSFMTACDALITNARMGEGEAVLIQAVTSAAGLAATQLAKAFGAGSVIGTSTSNEKLARVRDLGLTHPVNAGESDFVVAVGHATGGRGANVILDHIGGPVLERNLAASAVQGRIVSVGRLGEHEGRINLDELARKRVQLIGVTFRSRTLQEHADVVTAFRQSVLPLLRTGTVRPVVDRCFPLSEAALAQDYLRSNKHFGKIVLSVN